ncbi:MAG: hypothetical protein RLZZ519_2820 [Bacteroidota bacterium]|jgi:hypothetical protein
MEPSEILIGLAFFGGLFYLIYYTNKKQKERRSAFLGKEGLQEGEEIRLGKYVHGHPDIDKPSANVTAAFKGDDLVLYFPNQNGDRLPQARGTIKKAFVKNITIEDASTIEKRVTAGRLLAVGVFAFAMKKTEKTELAYLIIAWNDGRFEHETIFETQQYGAMELANIARNALIKGLR